MLRARSSYAMVVISEGASALGGQVVEYGPHNRVRSVYAYKGNLFK
jgi:hypothetical protein